MPGSNDDDSQLGSGLVGALETITRSPTDIHGLDTERIIELFEYHGYSCKPAGKLRGISGVLHGFDFVCTKKITGEKIVVQSFLHLGEGADKIDVEVVKLRLSTYDCSPDVCMVIASSQVEHVRQLATLYRLTIIDSSFETPYEQIDSLLSLQA